MNIHKLGALIKRLNGEVFRDSASEFPRDTSVRISVESCNGPSLTVELGLLQDLFGMGDELQHFTTGEALILAEMFPDIIRSEAQVNILKDMLEHGMSKNDIAKLLSTYWSDIAAEFWE